MTIDIKKLASIHGLNGYTFTASTLKNFAEAYAAKVHDKRVEELEAKNRELSVSINDLREALELALPYVETYALEADGTYEKMTKALSKTPAQSLQSFENEVIEMCAKVCDELVIGVPGRSDLTVDQCAKTIRAMKVT